METNENIPLRLPDSRYEELKASAATMQELAGVQSYPIDSLWVAQKLGYEVHSYNELGAEAQILAKRYSEDAFIMPYSKGPIDVFYPIYYNDEVANKPRLNVSVMHECAHIFLGHPANIEMSKHQKEAEAKFLAKFILAPPIICHHYHLKDASSIRTFFNLSYEAAEYAQNYYNKWLVHSEDENGLIHPTETECRLLRQVNIVTLPEGGIPV